MEYKVGQERIKLAYYEDGKSILTLTMNTLGVYTVIYKEMVTPNPECLVFDFDDFAYARNAFSNISSFLLSSRYVNEQYLFDDVSYSFAGFYNHIKDLAKRV